MSPHQAATTLNHATIAMFASGAPLMRRIVPAGAPMRLWDHYPPQDSVCQRSGARFFYHSHPGENAVAGEHGHLHLFLPRTAMPEGALPLIAPDRAPGPGDFVHLAGLSIDHHGLPIALFTSNRWATDEWLYPAAAIIAALPQFSLSHAPGDPLVNRWIGAAVALCAPIIAGLLIERDRVLLARDPAGEDRRLAVVSQAPLDLQALLDAAIAKAPPGGAIAKAPPGDAITARPPIFPKSLH